MIVRRGEGEMPVSVPSDAHTLKGFRTWVNSAEFPERGCISLVDGRVIVDMSAERAGSHNAVKTEITRVLGSRVLDRDLGMFFSDGMWITSDRADLSNEPDALFASWESFAAGRIELIVTSETEEDGIELRGAPDWVLEAISPSSVVKDTHLLPSAYYRAGVREYWMIDAREQELRFMVFVRGDDGFVEVPIQDDWARSQVFGCEFRLERERNRIGVWMYRLLVRQE
jgi:Uma2 family endonuclease